MNVTSRLSIRVLRCATCLSLGMLLCFAGSVTAQSTPPASIYEDTVWKGEIDITREVNIIGATVRVEPGTRIRLAAPPQSPGPVLRLSGAAVTAETPRREARLVLNGTPDRPVIVESPRGSLPGSIVSDPISGSSLVARHVVFRRVGPPVSRERVDPAIALVLTGSQNDLWLCDCRFENCGSVHAELIGVGATVEIAGCTFVDSQGSNCLVFIGTGDGLRVVADNVADSGFRIESPQVLIRDNVLIGESAAITVPTPHAEGVRIESNYVHCTHRVDDGRYAVRCHPSGATVSGNVLRGGTYVITGAPATVTGNVLIGTSGLEATLTMPGVDTTTSRSTTTHYLLTELPANARVTDNLLLGPAYAAIAVGRSGTNLRIENNLFDGWHVARRAVHFNVLPMPGAAEPIAAVLQRNVITRYRYAPITDGGEKQGTLAKVGNNLFADVKEGVYEMNPPKEGLYDGDVKLGSFEELEFAAPTTTRSALTLEDQLKLRRMTVADARRAWFDAYRTEKASPLHKHPDAPIGPRGED